MCFHTHCLWMYGAFVLIYALLYIYTVGALGCVMAVVAQALKHVDLCLQYPCMLL